LQDEYTRNEIFHWLVKSAPMVIVVISVAWVLLALAIGQQWKLAFDILIGSSQPNGHSHAPYPAALAIAAMGYLLVPALIGAVVSAMVSVIAVPRLTLAQASAILAKSQPPSTEPVVE
jgi:hypothetical protein